MSDPRPPAAPRGLFSERMRLAVLAATTVLIFAAVSLSIVEKERILRDGTPVLLRLAPVDPRSLIQGDYIALRYAISGQVGDAAREAGVHDGAAVIELDARGEARFVSIHQGEPLAPGQLLMRFRRRGDAVRLASDAFFFEEGHAEVYEDARFGEVRVGPDGEAVLTGLRDAEGNRLAPSGE